MASRRARSAEATLITILVLGASVATSSTAVAQVSEWKDSHLPDWLKLDAEYRVRSTVIDPLDLSGTEIREVDWTEQRLRLDLGLRYPGVGGVYVQLDLLDGVLFGDNGEFGSAPEPSSGLAVTSRWPNSAGTKIGLIPGNDPLNPDSYGPVLTDVQPIQINHAYGEVFLPVGLVRVGRQPVTIGSSIAAHDGGRYNRWGASQYSEVADRVLFGTKIDEAIKLLVAEDGYVPDTSMENGVLLIGAFDWQVQDDIYATGDDLFQATVGLQWRVQEADWLGADWKDFLLSAIMVYKFNKEFDTDIWAFPVRAKTTIGPVSLDLQYTVFTGGTTEVSTGFAVLSNDKPKRQTVLGMGAQALIDLLFDPVTVTLEFDYASGDDDPRSASDLESFTFARDLNVGLLLFEHILAFESARSAAVGIENLAQLDAASFPLTEVATDGRFTNALAIFPQVKVDILDGPDHLLHTRVGALFAWPDRGVVDPVMTILNEDGNEIADDAVNFHGGKPGSYYGTELDMQVQWSFRDLFTWTVEGAVLFPGDGLEDENGDAVISYLVENRFTFVF